MVHERKNVWMRDPWNEDVLWYARAVQVMKTRPEDDPTSWSYQASIHGRQATVPTPARAPWRSCQHQSWFFLPWHRMYLFYFEQIIRRIVVGLRGPETWALPYWDYESRDQASLPPAFRTTEWPDGGLNPLYAAQRAINDGSELLPQVTSSAEAMAQPLFDTPVGAVPIGFGGNPTGWQHGGVANGALEARPHNLIHVSVGGRGGLMSEVNTAALDPIFWLHHANIDRLWAHWDGRQPAGRSPSAGAFRDQAFELRDDCGRPARLLVSQVLDLESLGYTYDDLAAEGRGLWPDMVETAPKREQGEVDMAMIGRSDTPMVVTSRGGESVVPVRVSRGLTDAEGAGRWTLELADVTGVENPGVVYAVKVAPSGSGTDPVDVGYVSFFGIDVAEEGHSPLVYRFDLGGLDLSDGSTQELDVRLVDLAGTGAALDAGPEVQIGTVAVYQEP